MGKKLEVDISGFAFDQFIDFLFARDIPPETEDRGLRWFFHAKVTFDLQRVRSFYVQLFRHPSFLLNRFPKDQLELGFSAMQVRSLSCSAMNVIWNTELSFEEREECVKSMFHLFTDIFASDPLGLTASMWWDSFCFDWECGNRRRARGGEDSLMQDALFETLCEVLKIDSAICQGAVLHGLEHLHHPGTAGAIQHFLAEHPTLDDESRAYALSISLPDPLWMRTA